MKNNIVLKDEKGCKHYAIDFWFLDCGELERKLPKSLIIRKISWLL